MPTREENVRTIIEVAEQRGIPATLAIACAVAESGFQERAERWGDRTADAVALIAAGDHAGLEALMQDLAERGLRADISFGLGQQSWAFAPETDGSLTAANLLRLREIYFDPRSAARQMCALLAGHFRPAEEDGVFRALCRYNFPAGDGEPAADFVARNYRRGIAEAERLLAEASQQPPAGRVFPVVGFRGRVELHHGAHPGASDLFADEGTPVVCVQAGRVVNAGHGAIGGNFVLLLGDDGLMYYYAHGDRAPAVATGEQAATGAFLFGVGETGNAAGTGPHLHIGIGHEILSGAGPMGGAGSGFDAVGLLRDLLGGPRPDLGGESFRVVGTDGLGLRVRSEPGTQAAVLRVLPEGTIVQAGTLRAEGREWRLVVDAAGAAGFVADEFLASEGRRYRVANTDGAGLRLRQEPSTVAPSLKTLPEGSLVESGVVQAENRLWRLVRDAAGPSGFAAADFLVATDRPGARGGRRRRPGRAVAVSSRARRRRT